MGRDFYPRAASYWSRVPATVDGVLGGFECVSPVDVDASRRFVDALLESRGCGRERAVDCGAGIGRVAKLVLCPRFNTVDLVEPNEAFLDEAKRYVDSPRLGTLHAEGLQNFSFDKGYDVVWCQWVLCYLTDEDLVGFLKRAAAALAPKGVIVVKENATKTGRTDKDVEDSAVTRPPAALEAAFRRAGLTILAHEIQTDFPVAVYPVHMYALAR